MPPDDPAMADRGVVDPDAFTLIVPTYRRPGELARLLGFLARAGFSGRLLVLDSSPEPARSANARTIAGSHLAILERVFDPQVKPFDKFAEGAAMVETPYAAFCADDDLVFPAALETLVGRLAAAPQVVAVHGWYFGFRPGDTLELESIIYRGPSVTGATPLDRMDALLRSYEAVTYAVYRTPVLRHVLGALVPVDSLLFRELGGGVLTAVAGAIERLPVLHYGRALGGSQSYENWHPVEHLARSPAGLMAQYGRYRALVLADLARREGGDPDAAARLVDLLHLRYFAEFLRPAAVDRMIAGTRSGSEVEAILDEVVGMLPRSEGRFGGLLRRSAVFQAVRRRTPPGLRRQWAAFARLWRPATTRSALLPTGDRHRCRLAPAFLRGVRDLPGWGEAVDGLMDAFGVPDRS